MGEVIMKENLARQIKEKRRDAALPPFPTEVVARIQSTYGEEYLPFVEITDTLMASMGLTMSDCVNILYEDFNEVENTVVAPNATCDTTYFFVKLKKGGNMIHTFRIPYSMALSKNQSHAYGKKKVWTNPATKTEMDAIAYMCMPTRNAWIKGKMPKDTPKIKVNIHVHRPDFRSDPANFEPTILDGIKTGIGIDDNVFECNTTWELDKSDPHILITVEQEGQ